MNSATSAAIAIVLAAVTTVCAAEESALRPFSLYTRVTEKTVAQIVQHARPGDLFWGRPEEKIPRQYRAVSVRSHENLQNRLRGSSLNDYAAVVLDGEYRDYDLALADVKRLRSVIDQHNKDRKKPKLRFIAFFHMRIIDAKPEVISSPEIVMVGKSYWNAENILGGGTDRRRRSAPKYVAMIRKAGNKAAILLGSPDKESHTAESVSQTIALVTRSADSGGLGIKHVGFFYPADKANVLLAVLQKYGTRKER